MCINLAQLARPITRTAIIDIPRLKLNLNLNPIANHDCMTLQYTGWLVGLGTQCDGWHGPAASDPKKLKKCRNLSVKVRVIFRHCWLMHDCAAEPSLSRYERDTVAIG